MQKSIESYEIENIEQNEFDKQTYLLTINHNSVKSSMQTANELHETGLFEYVEPDLMLFIKYMANDTYFSDQWGLNNTGQFDGTTGVDIKAEQAWSITTGSPNIKIGVFDTGIDLAHPDLINNLLPGYDATGWLNNGGSCYAYDTNAHGTACAGIIAAQGNNSKGITGIAHGCKILPVYIGNFLWANTMLNSLNWAKQNGANVISISFFAEETNTVNIALSQLATAGTVIVAAAGNNNDDTIIYPAKHPDVIAVGAVTPCGERKRSSHLWSQVEGYTNRTRKVYPAMEKPHEVATMATSSVLLPQEC